METFDDLLEKAEKIRQNSNKEVITEGNEKPEVIEKEEEEKVETTEEVETTEKVESTEKVEEPKSFSDLLKDVVEVHTKPIEVPEEIKKEIDTYKAQLEETKAKLQSIESDPLVKAVLAGATKEQLTKVAAELNGKDFSKASYEELIRVEIEQTTGLSGEELQEQVALALDEFNSQPLYKQKIQEKSLRESVQSKFKGGESETLKELENAYLEKAKSIKNPADIQKELQETAEAEKASIVTLGKRLVGSELYGVKFTEEILNEIVEKDYAVDRVSEFIDEKGNLNVPQFIQSKFLLKNIEKIYQNGIEQGKKEAQKGTFVPTGGGKTSAATSNQKNPALADKEGLLPDYKIKQLERKS